jgi:hypothetical protein
MKLGGIAAITAIGLSKNTFSFPIDDLLLNLSRENFEQFVGDQFIIFNDSSSYYATLTNIKDFPSADKQGECFSIEFSVNTKLLSQSTYDIFHPSIGNFQLFMTEGKNNKVRTLMATINRI